MKRILFLGGFLLAMIVLVSFVGCEEDEDDVTGGVVDTARFELVSEMFGEGIFSYDQGLLDIAFNLIDSIPEPTRSPHPFVAGSSDIDSLVIATYEYSDFWHIFTLTATMIEWYDEYEADTFYFEGIDSLRFGDGTEYMQYPNSTTTELDIRCHFAASIASGPEFGVSMGSHASLDLTGEYEGDFTVNGNTSDTIAIYISEELDTCAIGATMSQTFTDLLFDSLAQYEESCPPSGSIVLNLGLTVECTSGGEVLDSLNIDGNWQISFVFSNRYVTGTYNDGTSSWSYTGYCGPDQVTSPIWHGVADYVREYR